MSCVHSLVRLAVMFGISTLWSRNLDSALDEVYPSSPMPLSSNQVSDIDSTSQPKVLLVPVKFVQRRFPMLFVASHFPGIDATNSGEHFDAY